MFRDVLLAPGGVMESSGGTVGFAADVLWIIEGVVCGIKIFR